MFVKIFAGDGYSVIAANQLWMCNAKHLILEDPNIAEKRCKKLCNTNGACNFVFSTNDLGCRLFSSCIGRTDTTEPGSIFKKLIGNQRFLNVLDILTKILIRRLISILFLLKHLQIK